MNCNKCGRELDSMRQMLAQLDPEVGTVCIECYNLSLIEKSNKLKEEIEKLKNKLTNSQ